jgi:8-amino-3,8-dideoxy-alpha-D-manno-octulosonate transaminase
LFEKEIADLTDHEYVISLANATMGIMGVFIALGIRNAEVIVNEATWPGSLSGPMLLGNKIMRAPLNASQRFDIDLLNDCITDKTKAILSCDIGDQSIEFLDQVKAICDGRGIYLIHDAARSFLSTYKGYHSGYFADVTVLSFGATKWFSMYEGACAITNNQTIYKTLVWHLTHPDRQLKELGEINEFAMNYRMNPLVAEYGLHQIRTLIPNYSL